ncbi:hypothetical protein LINPERPRIM_LOCUS19390 [Linum perenne]
MATLSSDAAPLLLRFPSPNQSLHEQSSRTSISSSPPPKEVIRPKPQMKLQQINHKKALRGEGITSGLRRTSNNPSVGSNRSLNLRVNKLNHQIILEDIYFLDGRDCVDSNPLQRTLKLLVVCSGRFVHCLLLSAQS